VCRYGCLDTFDAQAMDDSAGCYIECAPRWLPAIMFDRAETTTGAPTTTRVRFLDARGVFTPAHVVSHTSGCCLTPHPRSSILRGPNTRGKDPS